MRAALYGGNQVDVGLGDDLAALRQPLHGPVHGRVTAAEAAYERLLGNHGVIDSGIGQVILETVFVIPFFGLTFFLFGEFDAQAGAQHGLGLEHVLEATDGKFR